MNLWIRNVLLCSITTFSVTPAFAQPKSGSSEGGSPVVGSLASPKPALKSAKVKSANSPDMLTFRQWKTNRLFESKAVLAQINQEIKTAERRHQEKNKIDHLKHRYQQAFHNFEVAGDLNAHDYFVAYVTENFPNNVKALTFMVKHMSPAETADILIQYQHTLSQSQVSSNNLLNLPSTARSGMRSSAAGLSAARAGSDSSPTLADFGGRLQVIHRAIDDDPIREVRSGRNSPSTL